MKILKYLFFLLLIAIIAGAIYVATKDGKYQIEETIIVNAPLPVVYSEVNNLTNWDTWGPWRISADDLVVDYADITRGEGAGFFWRSEEINDGSIITTKVIPNSAIEQDLIHNPTFAESNSKMYWKFEEVEQGTKITLGMEGSQSFKEKLAFSLNDNSITESTRPKFAQALQNLEKTLLAKMSEYSINIDGQTTHGGGFYMYSTTATKISQIPIQMQLMLTDVKNYMTSNNISMQGDPFVLYNDRNEQNNSAIYSVGVFTPSLVITPSESNVLNGMMPVQKVIKTTLKGNYDNLPEAWEQTYSYIENNNLQADDANPPFEVYKTHPDSILNPANWVTEIFIPIAEKAAPDELFMPNIE